jgi:hypothetical protein
MAGVVRDSALSVQVNHMNVLYLEKYFKKKKQRCILALSASHRRGETPHMETAHPTPSQRFGKSPSGPFRGLLADAIRFWEPRRLIYNLVLTAVAVVWLVATWPHFRVALTLPSLLLIAILALLANVCYCAAYLVDIPMQRSSLSTVWRRLRWGLWLMGTLFATVVANYWIADEIYPSVR